MILSDVTIIKMLEEGSLKISPINKEQIQPASVDIRLGDTFSVVTDSPLWNPNSGQGNQLPYNQGGYLPAVARTVCTRNN